MGTDIQYIVSFIRKDGQPDENYVYYEKSDAEHHINSINHQQNGAYIQNNRFPP